MVAHLNRVQEAERSNRSAPTIDLRANEAPGTVPRASRIQGLPPRLRRLARHWQRRAATWAAGEAGGAPPAAAQMLKGGGVV